MSSTPVIFGQPWWLVWAAATAPWSRTAVSEARSMVRTPLGSAATAAGLNVTSRRRRSPARRGGGCCGRLRSRRPPPVLLGRVVAQRRVRVAHRAVDRLARVERLHAGQRVAARMARRDVGREPVGGAVDLEGVGVAVVVLVVRAVLDAVAVGVGVDEARRGVLGARVLGLEVLHLRREGRGELLDVG